MLRIFEAEPVGYLADGQTGFDEQAEVFQLVVAGVEGVAILLYICNTMLLQFWRQILQ